MQRQWHPAGSWLTNVLLAVGVVATVLLALLLSVADGLQMRPPPPRPTQVAAMVAQNGATITFTPVPPTVALPTLTATRTPPSETPVAEKKPSPTAVAMVPECGVVPQDWVPYVVQPGDTLFRLGINTGATVSALMVANCLDSTRVYAGMTLYVPLEPPPPPPICTGPPADWDQYRVQRGDTLFSLARSHGTTVYAVMTANCLVSTRINAGQLIYLPALAPTPTATATQAPPPAATNPPPPTATDAPRPTPTPTRQPTATPPATAMASATAPRPTATAPATSTRAATATATPTVPRPSPTATVTASATATASPTTTAPAGTPTPTSTATATVAPPTSTPTASPTSTSPVPTPTATPTSTPVPPTVTPTDTPVPPTDTPTPTYTPTPSNTPTPTSTSSS